MFWGFSEALDLFQEYLNALKSINKTKENKTDAEKTVEGEAISDEVSKKTNNDDEGKKAETEKLGDKCEYAELTTEGTEIPQVVLEEPINKATPEIGENSATNSKSLDDIVSEEPINKETPEIGENSATNSKSLDDIVSEEPINKDETPEIVENSATNSKSLDDSVNQEIIDSDDKDEKGEGNSTSIEEKISNESVITVIDGESGNKDVDSGADFNKTPDNINTEADAEQEHIISNPPQMNENLETEEIPSVKEVEEGGDNNFQKLQCAELDKKHNLENTKPLDSPIASENANAMEPLGNPIASDNENAMEPLGNPMKPDNENAMEPLGNPMKSDKENGTEPINNLITSVKDDTERIDNLIVSDKENATKPLDDSITSNKESATKSLDNPIPSDKETATAAAEPLLTENVEPIPQADPCPPNAPKVLNILLFGAADPRHVIKTMAKLYTHKQPDGSTPMINFYIFEGCIEIIARDMALLAVALENPVSFNMRSKVHLFMDIYGNTLLRPSSHQYLVGKAKTLLKMITDDEKLEELAPFLTIDGLKYRERDGLEIAFDFWLPKEGSVFNIEGYWDNRIRKLLGRRYDYREGAFDWDLNMCLKDRNAHQICSQEYRFWRETGIAFTYPEYEQCKPNKTLAVALVRNGMKFMHRGYCGDIQTGPFCGFGLKTTDERMLKSAHGDNDYRATDITERNVRELFSELHTRSPYDHQLELSRKYGSVRLLMSERLTHDECDIDMMKDYDKPWLNIDGCKIHFISIDDVFVMQSPTCNWQNFFDIIFVGNNYFPFVRETFSGMLRENGLLLLETKLLTTARKDDITEFEATLKTYAKNEGLTGVINYNALNTKNTVLRYWKGRDQKKTCK